MAAAVETAATARRSHSQDTRCFDSDSRTPGCTIQHKEAAVVVASLAAKLAASAASAAPLVAVAAVAAVAATKEATAQTVEQVGCKRPLQLARGYTHRLARSCSGAPSPTRRCSRRRTRSRTGSSRSLHHSSPRRTAQRLRCLCRLLMLQATRRCCPTSAGCSRRAGCTQRPAQCAY